VENALWLWKQCQSIMLGDVKILLDIFVGDMEVSSWRYYWRHEELGYRYLVVDFIEDMKIFIEDIGDIEKHCWFYRKFKIFSYAIGDIISRDYMISGNAL